MPPVPDHWQGAEVKQYLCDAVEDIAQPHKFLKGERLAAYENDVLVHNL